MAFQPEEDLTCSICQDIFKEPLVLSCSHSFCKECLKSWWTEKPTKECPFCKRRSSRSDPPRNLALKNLCEAFVQRREPKTPNEQVCKEHEEKLKLFCLTDKKPICVVCRDSTVHKNHRFKPVAEATTDFKEDLQKSLKPLRKRLKVLEEFKDTCDFTLAHIKDQTQSTAKQMEKEFLKLQDFIAQQLESRMKALREEEEQKTQRMKDKMAAVSREIQTLSETIRATEEQLRATDVSFLLKYKATAERVQHCPLLDEEPQLGPGALIDQAKYLGNLTFNIWNNMKKLVHYTPVVLDPNTAHPDLTVSNDLTSVRAGDERPLPKNHERVKNDLPIVRSYEGFTSGSHSWEVDVKNGDYWSVGVATESVFQMNDDDADVRWWAIGFKDGQYDVLNLHKKDTVVKAKSNPRTIKIHLECIKHKVTFYDADTNVCIHSFSKLSNKKLYLVLCSKGLISILPQTI